MYPMYSVFVTFFVILSFNGPFRRFDCLFVLFLLCFNLDIYSLSPYSLSLVINKFINMCLTSSNTWSVRLVTPGASMAPFINISSCTLRIKLTRFLTFFLESWIGHFYGAPHLIKRKRASPENNFSKCPCLPFSSFILTRENNRDRYFCCVNNLIS